MTAGFQSDRYVLLRVCQKVYRRPVKNVDIMSNIFSGMITRLDVTWMAETCEISRSSPHLCHIDPLSVFLAEAP